MNFDRFCHRFLLSNYQTCYAKCQTPDCTYSRTWRPVLKVFFRNLSTLPCLCRSPLQPTEPAFWPPPPRALVHLQQAVVSVAASKLPLASIVPGTVVYYFAKNNYKKHHRKYFSILRSNYFFIHRTLHTHATVAVPLRASHTHQNKATSTAVPPDSPPAGVTRPRWIRVPIYSRLYQHYLLFVA